MIQSLFLYFGHIAGVGVDLLLAKPLGPARLACRSQSEGEERARDYEIYYWSAVPAPWY